MFDLVVVQFADSAKEWNALEGGIDDGVAIRGAFGTEITMGNVSESINRVIGCTCNIYYMRDWFGSIGSWKVTITMCFEIRIIALYSNV